MGPAGKATLANAVHSAPAIRAIHVTRGQSIGYGLTAAKAIELADAGNGLRDHALGVVQGGRLRNF